MDIEPRGGRAGIGRRNPGQWMRSPMRESRGSFRS